MSEIGRICLRIGRNLLSYLFTKNYNKIVVIMATYSCYHLRIHTECYPASFCKGYRQNYWTTTMSIWGNSAVTDRLYESHWLRMEVFMC